MKSILRFLIVFSLLAAVLAVGLCLSLAAGNRPVVLLPFLLFLALSLVALLGFFFHFHVTRTIRRLSRTEAEFIRSDVNPLKVSLSELGRGNVSVRAEPGAPAATTRPDNGEDGLLLRPLLEVHRKISAQIRESINEFNLVTDFPCQRLFYVGADSFMEGKRCGQLMGRLLGGQGKVAVLMGSLVSAAQSLRLKGFQAALLEHYSGIEIVDVREDHKNRDEAYQITAAWLKANPDLAGIYAAQGATPSSIAQAVLDEEGSAAPGGPRVKIVTHDLTPDTMSCLARGAIAATLSQNPFAQGYNPVILLYNYLVNRENPVIIRQLTLLEEVTKDNYREYWDDARGALVSDRTKAALARPLINAAKKPFRIGVILQDDTGFWEPVAAGVREAAQALLEQETTVQAVVPEAIRHMDWSAQAFIPVIQSLIDAGCQAVSLPLFDRGLVPFINQKTTEGITVATYNSEPVSLRGMIDSVSRHASHLFQVSEDMAAGATENTQAINQISATMKVLFAGSVDQLKQLERTDALIRELIRTISQVRDETTESITVAGETKRSALAGYETIRETQAAIKTLDKNSQATTAAIKALNDNVMKMNDIIAFIENISTQTNLLAINASIQAAQAGEGGRGFSVVAGEIRKLAEQAGRATADITELIQNILAGVDRATASVIQSMEKVNQSVAMTGQTEAVLQKITEASSTNESKVEAILRQTEQMLGLSEDVQKAMTELTQLNQDNGAAMEEITASVVEMSREIDEIGKAARFLKDMGQSQEDLLTQFILD